MEALLEFLNAALGLFVALAPYLLLGFLVAGLIHAFLPAHLVGRWLGRPGLGSITRAALLGVPLPLCSCSVIPVAVQLRQGGATRGATASFLVSTPETGVDSISASIAVLHPLMVVFRPVAALLTALTAGIAVEWFGGDAEVKPPESAHCCHEKPSEAAADQTAEEPVRSGQELGIVASGAPTTRFGQRLRDTLEHAFVDLFADIAPWLLPAILVTAAMTTLLEPMAFADLFAGPWLQMAVMLVVGVPIYVCATAATPVAAGLIASGFSPGAALVFLLVGPATNLVTLRAAAATLGVRGAVAYGTSIALVSVACGVALDSLVAWYGLSPEAVAELHDHQHIGWTEGAAAVVFAVLIVLHYIRRLRR